MRFFLRIRNVILPLSILLVGVVVQLLQPYPVTFTRNLVFDQYNRWQPRADEGSPVIFVDIDEASLERIGQFPWPRSVFADLVTKMTEGGIAAIAFDILFAEADRTAPDEILPVWQNLRSTDNREDWEKLRADVARLITSPDDALARAMKNAPVIMATMMNNEVNSLPNPKAGIALRAQGGTDGLRDPMQGLPRSDFAIANRQVLNDNAIGLGSINARIDDDGIIRRATLLYRAGEHVFPSLSLESLRVAQRAGSIVLRASDVRGEGSYMSGFGLSRLKVGRIIAPIEPDGSMRLYYADSDQITTLSAADIVAADFDASVLEGKIAFIGTSAAGLKDIRATPLNPATPGVEVHIQTVQQLIAGTFLTRPIWVQIYEALATVVVGLILIFMVARYSIVPSLIVFFVTTAAGLAISWQQFSTALLLVDPATPAVTIFATFLTAAFLHFLQTARERRDVRNAFQYYLAPDMVEQIAEDPARLKLGGETRNLTILFCDIRGFTTISEAFADAPEKLTHIINIFLTGLSQAIQARAGTIDKYIGDNIMAFWNAPANVANHAYEACCATLDMKQALVEVNRQLNIDPMLDGWQGEIKIGIGLNSGPTLVGNIGSDQRFNYSVMGDTVNVAARLESQTKEYGVLTLIGSETFDAAQAAIADGAPPLAFVELDLIALKGKALPQRIYALLGDAEMAASPSHQQLQDDQRSLLEAYRAQDWDKATQQAKKMAQSYEFMAAYYEMLIARIHAYRADPPGDGWDGHYIALSK